MRLYTIEIDSDTTIAAELNGRLINLPAAQAAMPEGERGMQLPGNMLALLRSSPEGMTAVERVVDFAAASSGDASWLLNFDQVRLLAPLPRPGKILCSGVNYRGHLDENPTAVLPQFPFFFSKVPSAVVGPGDPIIKPAMTSQLDYEVELAVVIGKVMRHVPEPAVMNHVAGYTILHDVSARDVQFQDSQITLGKNFDSFAPMGPCLVTTDELPNLSNVRLRSLLNGRVMQDSTTAEWFYPLPQLLSFLSQVMTLEPGDIVTTGTPAGIGYFRQPQIFLEPGDVVIVEVEGIGQLENPVIAGD